jgi:hypothetical protein
LCQAKEITRYATDLDVDFGISGMNLKSAGKKLIRRGAYVQKLHNFYGRMQEARLMIHCPQFSRVKSGHD